MSKNKFYVVWKGKQPGVYSSWEECKSQIDGIKDAVYKSFHTEQQAHEAFNSPFSNYIKKKSSSPRKNLDQKSGLLQPIPESISVDAACSGNPGMLEYRGVYTRTGKEIFHQGPFQNGTNNIGEFLAIVHALALQMKKNTSFPIYSDSATAIKWVKTKKAKTKLKESPENKYLFELIERAETWLEQYEYSIPVLKWETEIWGEIPADFGRK